MSMPVNAKHQLHMFRNASPVRQQIASGHRLPARLAGSAHSATIELFGGLPATRICRLDVRSPERH